MFKRAQAAMEFLMTYGWAILVVLVAIGALAYFGVLNPGKFLPSSCTIGPGLACGEFKATITNITIQVRNGLGKSINVTTYILTPAASTQSCSVTSFGALGQGITDGAEVTFQFGCSGMGSVGDRFKATQQLTYVANGETMSHTMTGDLTTKVE